MDLKKIKLIFLSVNTFSSKQTPFLLFSLSGKNTLHLKFAAHSHVVTWETKRKTTTKTKHSINTLRVVPSLHSKWAFTLVRLSYAESKNCKFHGSQKFWCRPKPPGVTGGWKKNCRLAMALLLLSSCCCKQGQQQKNGSMFPHCCRSFKFNSRFEQTYRVPT